MVKSKEIIYSLKKKLNKRYYVSMFSAGSLPEKIIPGSDLDIFVILKKGFENLFLDNLTKIMINLISKNKKITYLFIRGGPIKYKHKGLVHFIIYSDEEDFRNNELLAAIRNLKKDSYKISGKTISEILKKLNLNDKEREKKEVIGMIKKQKQVQKKGYHQFKQWKKIKVGWKLVRVFRRQNNFSKEIVKKYYLKNLEHD